MNRARKSNVLRNTNVVGVLLILFIACFDVALLSSTRDADVYESPSKSDTIRWINASKRQGYNLPYTLRRSRTTAPKALRPPVMQVKLLKGHVLPDDTWSFSEEYVYSPKEFEEYKGMSEKLKNYEEESDMHKSNYDQVDQTLPNIGSRTIINVPMNCPEGTVKMDKRCRVIQNK